MVITKPIYKKIYIVIVTVLFLLIECSISYKKDSLEKDIFNSTARVNRTINVFIRGNYVTTTIDGRKIEKRIEERNCTEAIDKAFYDSEFFLKANVFNDTENKIPADADYIAELDVAVNYHEHWSGCPNSLTLGLIPARGEKEIIISMLIKDNRGKILKTYAESSTIIIWDNILLVFVSPFSKSFKALMNEICYESVRSMLSHAYDEKVFIR